MEKEEISKIVRFSHPSELDTAPQFTVCECADYSFWIQISKEEETPNWLRFESEEEVSTFLDDFKSNC